MMVIKWKVKKINAPYRLMTVHTVLILISMVLFYNRLFITDIPFDCFYTPFLLFSGPIVYFIAHNIQHISESYFKYVEICWNVIPGLVCIVLGGVQWIIVERFWLWINARSEQKKHIFHKQI